MQKIGEEGGSPLLALVRTRVMKDRASGEPEGREETEAAEHPSFSALDRLARGASPSAERQQIVHHLLAGCPGCCSRLRTLRRGAPARPEELEAAIDRAISRVQDLVTSVAETRERLARLLAFPPEQQLAVALTDEFCDPEICRLLLVETEETLSGSPVRILHLGRIAAAMARRLAARDPERFSELRSEARQRLTDRIRILGRPRQAAAPPEPSRRRPAF